MRALLTAVLCLVALPAFAQLNMKTYEFGVSAYGFHGLPATRKIRTFQAESEAVRVFQQIMGKQGISAEIQIRASGDVANAAAFLVVDGNREERIIAYNVLFMEEVKKKTGNYWSLISIMAHEVGHHLNFHTYTKGTPSTAQLHKDELEADYFSGHALARLGARLDEALSAMKAISPLNESATHPGRDARLQVIALGWKEGKGAAPEPVNAPAPPPPPQPPQPTASSVLRIGSIWSHNGSEMYITGSGNSLSIHYHMPREGMREEGVTSGTLLFDGTITGSSIRGTARNFLRECGEALYRVEGYLEGNKRRIVLTGTAYYVNRNGCNKTGTFRDRLVFDYVRESSEAGQ